MASFDITKDYFLEEYNKFRAIMCSKAYDLGQKLDAYRGLWFVYLNLKVDLPEKEVDLCRGAMGALDLELNMRIGYQMRADIEALVKASVKAGLLEADLEKSND